MSTHSYIFADAAEASASCAAKIIELLEATVATRVMATLAVSGGSTPKLLFGELGGLEAARHTLMPVAGNDKAEPLREVLHGPYTPRKFPIQIATYNNPNALWFLDNAAARLMD